jgi:hypothetical protein
MRFVNNWPSRALASDALSINGKRSGDEASLLSQA